MRVNAVCAKFRAPQQCSPPEVTELLTSTRGHACGPDCSGDHSSAGPSEVTPHLPSSGSISPVEAAENLQAFVRRQKAKDTPPSRQDISNIHGYLMLLEKIGCDLAVYDGLENKAVALQESSSFCLRLLDILPQPRVFTQIMIGMELDEQPGDFDEKSNQPEPSYDTIVALPSSFGIGNIEKTSYLSQIQVLSERNDAMLELKEDLKETVFTDGIGTMDRDLMSASVADLKSKTTWLESYVASLERGTSSSGPDGSRTEFEVRTVGRDPA